MKKLVFLAIATFSISLLAHEILARAEIGDLSIDLSSNSKKYILGEPVTVNYKVSNNTSRSISFHTYFETDAGYVKFYLSRDGENYLEYIGPGWGLADFIALEQDIPPKFSKSYSVKIYRNHIMRESIRTSYAFADSGDYYIKAVIFDIEYENKIESKPILITILQPNGADAEVWNRIKRHKEYAAFIHSSIVESTAPELIENVEEMIEQYPDSRITGYMRSALEKYKTLWKK